MQPKQIPIPMPSPVAARRGEGVLFLTQENGSKSLLITGVNDVLEQQLGYSKDELLARKLETILGERTAESLAEDLEYIEDAPDFGDLFARIRDVRLRKRSGEEIAVNCTLSRMVAQGSDAAFQIVIPNDHEVLSAQKLREFIATNLEGRKELDAATGLPNHKTAQDFLPLLKAYLASSNINVVFAVMRIDRHEKSLSLYGRDGCTQLMMHVYNCCRSTFRADDIIFALSDRTLGVVLFDISRESARVVFNRLRWRIRNHRIVFGGKSDFSVSTCIGFDMLNADEPEAVFAACEKKMVGLDVNERNALIELGQV